MVSYHMARQEELSVPRQEVIYSILGEGGLLLYVVGRKSLPVMCLGISSRSHPTFESQ